MIVSCLISSSLTLQLVPPDSRAKAASTLRSVSVNSSMPRSISIWNNSSRNFAYEFKIAKTCRLSCSILCLNESSAVPTSTQPNKTINHQYRRLNIGSLALKSQLSRGLCFSEKRPPNSWWMRPDNQQKQASASLCSQYFWDKHSNPHTSKTQKKWPPIMPPIAWSKEV